jgi:hypothetical protein
VNAIAVSKKDKNKRKSIIVPISVFLWWRNACKNPSLFKHLLPLPP